MKNLVLALAFLSVPHAGTAQTQTIDRSREPKHGAAYVELFGNGQIMPPLGASANIEVKVGPHLFARLGAGSMMISDSKNGSGLAMLARVFPLTNGWAWEVGAGVCKTNAWLPRENWDERPVTGSTFSIGIRRQIRGDLARITFTPLTGPFARRWKTGRRFIPAVGISLGKTF